MELSKKTKRTLGPGLIEETYSSGRGVKNTFDQDGNLSQVQSKKNSSSGYWAYMDAISPDSAGNDSGRLSDPVERVGSGGEIV